MIVVNILAWIVIAVIYILTFIFLKREIFDKAESIYEKIIIIIAFIVLVIPIALFFIDAINLPTFLGFTKKVDLKRWTDFIFNYVAVIAGSVVSGMILLVITLYQINTQQKNNKEERRINNLPLMKYTVSFSAKDLDAPVINLYDGRKGNPLTVAVELQNVGLNLARKCYASIESENIVGDNKYKFPNQGLLERGSALKLAFRIPINAKSGVIKFKIIYQDVLFNWYEQIVSVSLSEIQFTKIYGGCAKVKTDVMDEKRLDVDPSLDFE